MAGTFCCCNGGKLHLTLRQQLTLINIPKKLFYVCLSNSFGSDIFDQYVVAVVTTYCLYRILTNIVICIDSICVL